MLSWLAMVNDGSLGKTAWQGLAFHVVLTQKGKNPIAINSGYLDIDWLRNVSVGIGPRIISTWMLMLKQSRQRSIIDSLSVFLLEPCVETWVSHLIELSNQKISSPLYDERSIIKMIQLLEPHEDSLVPIFKRERGTKQFGRALRNLGIYNRAILNDTLNELSLANSVEEVLSILSNACAELEVAKGKSPFIRLPNWTDVTYLIAQVFFCKFGQEIPLVS